VGMTEDKVGAKAQYDSRRIMENLKRQHHATVMQRGEGLVRCWRRYIELVLLVFTFERIIF